MIIFDEVWKFARRAKDPSLSGINCTFENGWKIAILCERERDASFLVNVLTGSEHVDRGRIIRRGRVSWPVGDSISSKGNLTVRDNLRFLARVYGLDADAFVKHVDGLIGFGKGLHEPVNKLDRGDRLLMSYATVLAIPFDWYIVSGEIKGASRNDTAMLQEAFSERFRDKGVLVITNDPEVALAYGELGIIYRDGRFDIAEDVEQAARIMLRRSLSADSGAGRR
jgi:capsular polysaccharide transport system ATP-binding protein